MDVLYEIACGLDVHRDTVVACILRGTTRVQKELKSFSNHGRGLVELREWLQGNGVVAVAMESTGVYWKPVYAGLEGGGFALTVANAQHVKKVPGRKTYT